MGEKTFKFLSRCSFYISGVTIAFGVMVLTGWILHLQRLKGLIPGQVPVKANTAVCFVLIGTALWLTMRGARTRFTKVLPAVLALFASLVGLLSFLEFWRGWDFGIDQLLFTAGPDDLPGSARIALMSPISAADFFLLGIALALMNVRARWSLVLQRVCCVIAAVAALFGILDFVLDPRKTHTYIAPLTALILFLCSLAVLMTQRGGLGALLVSGTVGGELCRRLLPAGILIPMVIAWLRWNGEQLKFFSDWTGLAIMTLSSGVFLAGLTVWTAIALDRMEVRRERAEESSYRLAAIVTSSNDGIISETLDGIVTSWNPGAEAIYGYSAEEMVGQSVTRLIPGEKLEEFRTLLRRGAKGESIRNYETVRICKDQKTIAVAVSISPLKDGDGKLVGACTIARDISERKAAEQALANERRRFEAVLDSLPVMVCLLRPDHSMAFANRSFRKQFGEPRGRKCYEFCFGKAGPCEFCHSFDVLKNDRPTDWQVVTNDGRIIHAYDFPFADSDGSPLVLEMDVDVTEQKAAERKLQEASRYTRSLIEASLDPLVTISKEGKITDVNEATEKATGLSRNRLIGSDFSNYFTEPQKAREGYEKVFEKGFVRDYPLAIRSTSGAVTDVLYNATVFAGAHGDVEGVFAAARDITQRKRAEDEIRKLNRDLEDRVQQRTGELRASEQSVRRKLESILSPEGDVSQLELRDLLDVAAVQSLFEVFYKRTRIPMFVLDLKGEVVAAVGWQDICVKFHRANPQTCKNCHESDLELGKEAPPGEFRLYKCKNNMWDAATPLMLGEQRIGTLFCGQFFFADEPLDYPAFRAQAQSHNFDEKEYLAALERTPRLTRTDVDMALGLFAKIARMLSQLNYGSIKLARSVAETDRANARLAAANRELEAFTYSVSHDLRAPLRHISGFSKILSEEFTESLPPEAQHNVQRIAEGTRRMGELVDDLLNLGRVGRRELSRQVAGLRSIVDDVIESLKPDIGDRQVEWKIGELPFAECDAGLMRQVFQNLLANALKFTRPRAQAVIEIGQEQRDGVPVIFVRDNGVGFSMKYADKLFGVFQRLHRTEDFEGTGVGLATVQRIIQKHGGRIWAEAELDRGAAFYFTLSAAEAEQKAPQSTAARA